MYHFSNTYNDLLARFGGSEAEAVNLKRVFCLEEIAVRLKLKACATKADKEHRATCSVDLATEETELQNTGKENHTYMNWPSVLIDGWLFYFKGYEYSTFTLFGLVVQMKKIVNDREQHRPIVKPLRRSCKPRKG